MINFLKSWAINIVTITIFVTFLEIILPSGTMKRYIRLIIGSLVIIVLINPFINLLSSNINIDKEVFAQIFKNNNLSNIYSTKKLENEQKKQIIELYKNKIKREIKNLISKTTNYVVEEIYVDIIEEDKDNNFGKIENVNLSVRRSNLNDKKNIIRVDKIQNIEVEISKSNLNTQNYDSSIEYSTIKEVIYKYYNIPKENICVNNYQD